VHGDEGEVDEPGCDERDPGDVHDEWAAQPEGLMADRFGLELFRVGEAGTGDQQQCDCCDSGNGEDGERYPIGAELVVVVLEEQDNEQDDRPEYGADLVQELLYGEALPWAGLARGE